MQSQTTKRQIFEWLPDRYIARLLALSTAEFKAESYDINKVARTVIIEIDKEFSLSSQKAMVVSPAAVYSKQVINFCAILGGVPRYYIELLNEEILSSQSHIITLNSKNDIIISRLFRDFQLIGNNAEDLPDYPRQSIVKKEIFFFVNMVSRKICQLYETCAQSLNKQMKSLSERVKKSRIMNNFLLYKIFREISDISKQMVQEKSTEGVFRNCPKEIIEEFARYIINKFEVVHLFSNVEVGGQLYEPSVAVFLGNLQRNEYVNLLPKEAVSNNGKFGIFLKTHSDNKQQQRTLDDYLLVLDQNDKIRVLNCKTLRKKWYIIGNVTGHVRLSAMGRDYLVQGQHRMDNRKRKNEPIEIEFEGLPIDNFTNTNGLVGRSLYMMRRYNGVGEFFKDISKRAILTRSIQQIMSEIPIIGYMIFAGTFSANFYRICSNRFSTDQRKLKQLGGFFINTGTTVGTSVLGALTGQMLIPIPFVGALVGTVIGGYIGDKGGKQINSWIQKKRFTQIINYLQKSQIDQKFWLCTSEFYQILELKESEFRKYIPSHMQECVFATLICFVLVCFYQSKRLNAYNQEKVRKIAQKEKKRPKSGKQEKKQQVLSAEAQFEQDVLKMNLDQDFEPQFNLTLIIDFLEENGATLYEHYDVLEKSILNFLSKIL